MLWRHFRVDLVEKNEGASRWWRAGAGSPAAVQEIDRNPSETSSVGANALCELFMECDYVSAAYAAAGVHEGLLYAVSDSLFLHPLDIAIGSRREYGNT